MPPNSQLPPLQPQQNPYDYLLNPAAAPKKSFIFGSGKPNKIVMALFVLFVIVLVAIGFALYSSLTRKNYDSVIGLAQRQEEIIRIADLGLRNAKDSSTLTYVSTVRNVTLSEQADTLDFLSKKGEKVSIKQLALKQDSATDKSLGLAAQNNTYDQVLLTALNGELEAYQKAQKNADISDSASGKTLLTKLTSNTKTISSVN